MYVQPLLEESRIEVLWDLMAAHPLGALVLSRAGEIEANHLPFEVDAAAGLLRCHVARGNPLWRDTPAGARALVIFQGPNHYVSPGWQPSRRTSGRVAPSWNYAVAHVQGPIRFVQDEAWLRAHLEALAGREEAARPEPWSLASAPGEFVGALLEHIVGVEIAVERLVGKSQACQQYSAANRAGVVEGLLAEGSERARAMAAVIRAASPA